MAIVFTRASKKKKNNNNWQIPEVEFFSGAVAQILSVIETDQALGTVWAGQGRKEACGLTFITLSLIIRQQLKSLTLCFGNALQETKFPIFLNEQ